jgi:hypothetical protein
MSGFAVLFRVRPWLFIDAANPPQIVSTQVDGLNLRFYCPYRDRPAEALVLSHIFDPARIPYPPDAATSGRVNQQPEPGSLLLPVVGAGPGNIEAMHVMFNSKGVFLNTFDPKRLPADSIRIDVEGTDHDKLKGQTTLLFTSFMKLLRWRSGQWWLTRTTDGLFSPGGTSFPIDHQGAPVSGSVRQIASMQSLSGFEQLVNKDVWELAINDIQSGTKVPIHEVLLLDANHSLSIADLRQVVIQAASACDIVKENTCERLWIAANPGGTYDNRQRKALMKGWDLREHFKKVLARVFRHDYRALHVEHWRTLCNLWEARNRVAHGDHNTFGSPPVEVTRNHARDFLRTARHCVDWLLSL